MIERTGFDLVEVARIARALENPRFLRRVFTPSEIEAMGEPLPERVAGRWAAKEAVAKAVGTHLRWQDVEILSERDGRPVVRIFGGHLRPDQRIHLSISHERTFAGAMAILERMPSSANPL